jgi:hypothetical protein
MRTLDAETARGHHRTTAFEVTPIDCVERVYQFDHPQAEGPLLHASASRRGADSDEAGVARPSVKTPENALQHLHVMLRCNRWGTYVRWSHRTLSKNPKPQGMNSWWGPIVFDGNVEQIGIESVRDICPVNIDEALETDRCVKLLPDKLRKAMLQEHVIRGTQAQKAAALGIDRTTFWRHCERAYVLLLGMFNDVAAQVPVIEPKDDDE